MAVNYNDVFWSASIEDLKKGYQYHEKKGMHVCLLCGKGYEKGIIYNVDNGILVDSKKAVIKHVEKAHGSVFEFLINMSKSYTGLSDVQTEILQYLYKGYNDKQIVHLQSKGSTSTIRNHRFRLKEKTKQAKIFLTIMDLLENESKVEKEVTEKFLEIHKGARQVDDRYDITNDEREKILKNYLDSTGKLKNFPSKEKRKIIILKYIADYFEQDKEYAEKEVNNIIKNIFDDYVTIRRYLIEYGFMVRSRDCSSYWLK